MAFARLAPLALFFLATSMMFSMKNTEAVDCGGHCSPIHDRNCDGSNGCSCLASGHGFGICVPQRELSSSVAKMIDEHPNICQSDDECMKKGSGNFCARYPNHYMDYGLCFNSGSDELKGFLAMPRAISK